MLAWFLFCFVFLIVILTRMWSYTLTSQLQGDSRLETNYSGSLLLADGPQRQYWELQVTQHPKTRTRLKTLAGDHR